MKSLYKLLSMLKSQPFSMSAFAFVICQLSFVESGMTRISPPAKSIQNSLKTERTLVLPVVFLVSPKLRKQTRARNSGGLQRTSFEFKSERRDRDGERRKKSLKFCKEDFRGLVLFHNLFLPIFQPFFPSLSLSLSHFSLSPFFGSQKMLCHPFLLPLLLFLSFFFFYFCKNFLLSPLSRWQSHA